MKHSIIILFLSTSLFCMNHDQQNVVIPELLNTHWMQIAGYLPMDDKNTLQRVNKLFKSIISINNPEIYLYGANELPQRHKQYGLLLSIYKEKPAITQHLLQNGADPDHTDARLKRTPRELAHCLAKNTTTILLDTQSKCVEQESFFIDCYFGTINTQQIEKYVSLQWRGDPLSHTIRYGHSDVAELLLSCECVRSKINIDNTMNLAIKLALKYGHIYIVELLKKRVPSAFDQKKCFQYLLQSTQNFVSFHPKSTEFLCKQTDINQKHSEHQATPLHWAALNWKYDEIAILCSHGADINSQNKYLETPLLVATKGEIDAYHRNESLETQHMVISYLLQQPTINVNLVDNRQQTPLDLAYAHKHETVINLLREHGAQTYVECEDLLKNNGFHKAARYGYREVIERSWNEQEKINAFNAQGESPLSIAVKNGLRDTTASLLQCKNINPLLPLPCHYTVLHAAVLLKKYEIIQLLLNHTPELINIRLPNGTSALHMAVKNNDLTATEILLACKYIKCNYIAEGKTPLNSAYDKKRNYKTKGTLEERNANTDIITSLLKHGAKTKKQLLSQKRK